MLRMKRDHLMRLRVSFCCQKKKKKNAKKGSVQDANDVFFYPVFLS